MEYIEVEYNQDLSQLESILSDVSQPGDFFVAGTVEIPMPRVVVEGAGPLSFPMPVPQIKALVQLATRAPYGRGEETIVDTSVRNVWQIPPSAVKIGGKSWATSFDSILSKVTAGLGCEKAKVSAELYKMLIYDRGGFFLPHRDTEKTAGMFGTLVVTLPSSYSGGALRIRHADREITVETGAAEPSELSFVAFYADCEHEALPVEEGSRVCLVYNLIQERAKGRSRTLRAPDYRATISAAASVLEQYWSVPGAPPKVAWLLEHQYSPSGLSFSSLKGADDARSRVLVQAAAQAGCVAHLGVVHIEESGAAEPDYYTSRRSRYRDYYHGDDDEEDEEEADFTAVTVDESWKYLDEWRDTDDRVVEFGQIPLRDGELLPAGALDEEPPDEQRLTEASGNEGATYERSYHRAALVLWPQNLMADVLLEGGVAATLPYLKRLAAGGKRVRLEAMALADRIMDAWPTGAPGWESYSRSPGSPANVAMMASLVELNAPALLERFIREIGTASYDGAENAVLKASVSVLGEKRAATVLSALVAARMRDRPSECAALLLVLAADRSPSLHPVAEAAVAGLDAIKPPASKPNNPSAWPEEGEEDEDSPQRSFSPEFIANLFSGLRHFNGGALCGAAADKIASRPEVFNPTSLVVPSIERIRSGQGSLPAPVDLALQTLWTSAAEFLLLRSEVPPPAPDRLEPAGQPLLRLRGLPGTPVLSSQPRRARSSFPCEEGAPRPPSPGDRQ